MLAFGSGNFAVSVQADGAVVDGVEIVAEPVGEGLPVEALPLFGSRTTYLVTGVSDGAWRVHVSAAGYTPQTLDVTVPVAAPVTVNLARAGTVVPDLFGQPLLAALAVMRSAGLEADLLIDAFGEEISRSQVPAEYQNQPILTQLPEAGAVVDAATTPPATGRRGGSA